MDYLFIRYFIITILAASPSFSAPHPPSATSVPYTHSHNDYEQTYPLFEALIYGFISVEADIWLYPDDQGNLRVNHDPVTDPSLLPTLPDLYLKPLQNLCNFVHNGGIYLDGTPIILLIDIKSESISTYQRLDQILSDFFLVTPIPLFTRYFKTGDNQYTIANGAITVIISGNRPLDVMWDQEIRYAGYDGKLGDIGENISPGFMPLVSDNWNAVFHGEAAWNGVGSVPEPTQEVLSRLVHNVHGEGKMFRIWNLPRDDENVWKFLYDNKVDLINTDNLAGLSQFIKSMEKNHEIH